MAAPLTLAVEHRLWRQGLRLVAGVDEVGRGPLAGPVVAAAVVLPPGADFLWLARVRDSKLLTAGVRAELAPSIRERALAIGLGLVSPAEIDRVGIVAATRQAMLAAVAALPRVPDFLLIDGRQPLPCSLPQKSLIDGDALVPSIACASIVAKVFRDDLMRDEDRRFSGYGFIRHKGYATPEHLAALHRLGPCDIHRRSYAPVRELLEAVR